METVKHPHLEAWEEPNGTMHMHDKGHGPLLLTKPKFPKRCQGF